MIIYETWEEGIRRMIGFGTLVNAIAIIVGGCIGCVFKKGLPKECQDGVLRSMGLAVAFIGVNSAITTMMALEDTAMLIVVSLAVGTLIGELIGIDAWFENLGEYLKKRFSNEKDNSFMEGFLTTTFTVCIGAMAVVGAMEDGINQNYSTLYTKSILDFILVIMMASTYGKGAAFSVVPVVVLQGSLTLLAACLGAFMSELMITYISLIGGMLITCVGLNLLLNAKIKVANMLPALIIAVLFALI